MKPTENIRRLIKNTKIKTNPAVNKAVLNELLETLDKSKVTQPNIWRIIIKNRITKFAVAAAIIIAAGLFFVNYSRHNSIESPKIAATSESKTPAEMLTMASLNLAYRRGGMKAAEAQSLKALKMTGVGNLNIGKSQKAIVNNNGI